MQDLTIHCDRASESYCSGGNNAEQYSWTADFPHLVKGQNIIRIIMLYNLSALLVIFKLVVSYVTFLTINGYIE